MTVRQKNARLGGRYYVCRYKRASKYDPANAVTACATIKPLWNTSEDRTRITCPLCRRIMLPENDE